PSARAHRYSSARVRAARQWPLRRSSIDQKPLALLLPRPLVGNGHGIEIACFRVRIIDPLAQQRRTVDDIDGELVEDIFVREVAPQIIVRLKAADRLEGERLEPPRLEPGVVVERALGVDENAMVELT